MEFCAQGKQREKGSTIRVSMTDTVGWLIPISIIINLHFPENIKIAQVSTTMTNPVSDQRSITMELVRRLPG